MMHFNYKYYSIKTMRAYNPAEILRISNDICLDFSARKTTMSKKYGMLHLKICKYFSRNNTKLYSADIQFAIKDILEYTTYSKFCPWNTDSTLLHLTLIIEYHADLVFLEFKLLLRTLKIIRYKEKQRVECSSTESWMASLKY